METETKDQKSDTVGRISFSDRSLPKPDRDRSRFIEKLETPEAKKVITEIIKESVSEILNEIQSRANENLAEFLIP